MDDSVAMKKTLSDRWLCTCYSPGSCSENRHWTPRTPFLAPAAGSPACHTFLVWSWTRHLISQHVKNSVLLHSLCFPSFPPVLSIIWIIIFYYLYNTLHYMYREDLVPSGPSLRTRPISLPSRRGHTVKSGKSETSDFQAYLFPQL